MSDQIEGVPRFRMLNPITDFKTIFKKDVD